MIQRFSRIMYWRFVPDGAFGAEPGDRAGARAGLGDWLRGNSGAARLGLMVASAVLLTLALAPWYQFYLAWIALAPWMIVIARARSVKSAWLWGFCGGAIFFLINLFYLVRVTVPGALALSLYLALFWAFAAGALHAGGLLNVSTTAPSDGRAVIFRCCAIAAVWTAFEWLRGTLLTGLPWLYVGHTQSVFPAMCQIADLTGVYGITFVIAAVNALIALAILHRVARMQLIRAAGAIAVLLCIILIYGVVRLAQAPGIAGPRLMVVQPNDPMTRGEKSESQEQSLRFHLRETTKALAADPAVDLVVWNETTMPPLNPEARAEPGLAGAAFLKQVDDVLCELTRRNQISLLAGGYYVGGWKGQAGHRRATDIRNAAFLYDRKGEQAGRYDKIHLVPFGEFIPFKVSLPWLFQIFLWLGPNREEYTLTSANPEALTVFTISPRGASNEPREASGGRSWRFVTPICFEDLDAPLVRMMVHSGGSGKRADFIVNITNDGWFRWNQMSQHLQASVFRCIENRVPMARAVNTGISGFIDSAGRTHDLIPAGREGTRVARLTLDSRVTVYSRIGDAFAIACTAAGAAVIGWRSWPRRRRQSLKEAPD